MRTPPDDVLPIRRQALSPFVLHAALLLVVILTACSQNQSGSTTSGGPRAGGAGGAAAPAAAPSPTPVAARPDAPLSLPLKSGEYAVTANRDDRTLAIVPIGLGSVVSTVPLDGTPGSIATVAGPDRAFVASATDAGQALEVTDLDTMSAPTRVEVGASPDQVIGPPPASSARCYSCRTPTTPSVRSIRPPQMPGPVVQLGAGPHAVAMAATQDDRVGRILIANAGDGTLTLLAADGASVEGTIAVGGRPIGVAASARLTTGQSTHDLVWVADGDTGVVSLVDATTGTPHRAIPVGPKLTRLAATSNSRYLVLLTSDPAHPLYAVDVSAASVDPSQITVRDIPVDVGILTVATGLEPTLAYATTVDGRLLYLDLVTAAVTHAVAVGHDPVSLALGVAKPTGAEPPVTYGSGGDSASGTGAAGGGATSRAGGGAGTSAVPRAAGAASGNNGSTATGTNAMRSTTTGARTGTDRPVAVPAPHRNRSERPAPEPRATGQPSGEAHSRPPRGAAPGNAGQ